jgi:non-heme chloroperoxidase
VSFTEANGANLFVEQKGTGIPVVFVHGTMSDYRVWKNQTDFLSKSCRTIAFSRRFAAPNTNPGDVMTSTIEKNSADLTELIRKLGISPVHLIGHSYGGFTAAYFATQHPEMLRSLTLNNAAVATMLISDPSNPLQLLSLLFKSPSVATSARRLLRESKASAQATQAGNPERGATIFYEGLFDSGVPVPKLPGEFRQMMVDNARTLVETTTKFPTLNAAAAGKIRVPTLVIRGEGSAIWDKAISERLSKAIQGSNLSVVSGGGHFCMIENPTEFNAKLTEFIGKHG